MTPFDDIPLVDGHLHPPLLTTEGRPLAAFFGEAGESAEAVQNAAQTLFFRRAVRELADLLGCAADAGAVERARDQLSLEAYLALLVRDANVEAMLVDDGYPPAGALSVDTLARWSGGACHRLLRIETLAESLLPRAGSAADLGRLLVDALGRERAIVGLKTIVAYRSGLAVEQPGQAAAERAFAETSRRWQAGRRRLDSKPLLDFLLLLALDWAAEQGLPVQFHTGYGDRDLDLPLANPALLRPLLEQPRFARLTVVLLHASYPYSREASYLAAVYPRVFVDWSQANPMLSPVQLQRLLEELLALAPYSKLLYGSDAWGIPDWLWLAARAGRAALAAVLADDPDRDWIARRILRDNARELYGLDRWLAMDPHPALDRTIVGESSPK